ARHELDVLNQDSRTLPEGTRQRLTERERVILAQLVEGASSKQVARSLGISPRTVEFHRANLLRKLEARNAAELIAKAMARG
ncbi:MAG: helix-turn-helix transcriptional regulator, partial [Alphaproteobacteria bacterium]|nr:helix-turn-helix transcriptional regulator [Alphaproteobacteria bacterium]